MYIDLRILPPAERLVEQLVGLTFPVAGGERRVTTAKCPEGYTIDDSHLVDEQAARHTIEEHMGAEHDTMQVEFVLEGQFLPDGFAPDRLCVRLDAAGVVTRAFFG